MNKDEAIKEFAFKRPDAVAIYGYGSGIIPQDLKTAKSSQLDIIFTVNDIKQWHMQNIKDNADDYSMMGRLFLTRSSVEKIKGLNGITYFSHIKNEGYTFKYGVIEIQDFMNSLGTWQNLFVAGRFQKPVLMIKTNELVEEKIDFNRHAALIVSGILCNEVEDITKLYETICSLSYIGDFRMGIAENPHKISNIVSGSKEKFASIYRNEKGFVFDLKNEKVYICHQDLIRQIPDLPSKLVDYLAMRDTDLTDINSLRINLLSFFLEHNQKESKAQIVHGIWTNGIVKSVPYALAKVKKRFW